MRGIKKSKLLEIFTVPEWLRFFELFLLGGRQLNKSLDNQAQETIFYATIKHTFWFIAFQMT